MQHRSKYRFSKMMDLMDMGLMFYTKLRCHNEYFRAKHILPLPQKNRVNSKETSEKAIDAFSLEIDGTRLCGCTCKCSIFYVIL